MLSLRFLAPALALTAGLLAAGPRVDKLYAHAPLRFEPNVGQADPAAAYVARGAGFRMVLTGDQAVLAPDAGAPLRMTLAGARTPLAAIPEDRLPSISNYYFGNDPKQWHANVPNYGRVKFEQVYPGIDVVYYGNAQGLEYDLIVAPGADPSRIRWAYSGADSVRLDSAGDLVLALRGHEIRQRKPTIYQEVAGQRREVRGKYELAQGGEVRLAIGKYDETATLVIDPPVLVYSTYLGGNGADSGYGIAVDSTGAVYIAGQTTSANFPTLNAYQSAAGNATDNAFVAKFNASGVLVYSTYLSGTAECEAQGIAVDSSGAAYIAGTAGGNFPLLNPAQATFGGGFDAFVAKLNATGGLAYSTYLGGTGDDEAKAIAVDSSGNMYIAGFTSGSFPTLNAAQGTYGGGILDGFAVKLTAAGALAYSTYLGGSNQDAGYSIAVDSSGSAYISGATHSSDFPTLNAFQAVYSASNGNAFVVKLSSTGALQYATYLGGPVHDVGWGIAVDSTGAAYVTGTTSGGFPLQNPAQATFGGGQDAFVTKLSPSGSSLLYSTYLGGAGIEIAYTIALDSTGAAYINGQTSGSFPVQNALQTAYGGGAYDAFVAEFNPSGGIVYATYLGGAGADYGYGIGVDSTGAAYVTGSTSGSFPTVNAYQSAYGGGTSNAFVAKISPAATIATAKISSIFPDTAVAGGAVFTLAVGGSKFVSGAVVSWNGTALATTFVATGSLTATVPQSLFATPGVVLVTVTNPSQSSSNAATFNIVAAPVPPTLTSVRATYGYACGGTTGPILVIAGSGFESGITFYWNGTTLASFTAPASPFDITVPSSFLQTPGNVTITASNGGAMSNGFSFTVPAPISLTNISPLSAPAGSGNITVTVTGTNFVADDRLEGFPCGSTGAPPIFGSSLTNLQFISGTELQATIPAADLTTAGAFPIWADNGLNGVGGVSNFFPSNLNLTFTVTASTSPQYIQQGSKLVSTGAPGSEFQGLSVALSADGNTALIGGFLGTSVSAWPVWIYKRSGGGWTQTAQLTGTGFVGSSGQGIGVALSWDGNTAVLSLPFDNSSTGAAWVFTQSNGVWTQQGAKLVGSGATGAAQQGTASAISGDGNTILVGGDADNGGAGATWVFTRSNGVWTQQGAKLVGSGASGVAHQASLGNSLALSYDGTVAAIGGNNDNNGTGAVWIFTQTGGTWTQQGAKLVGTGAVGAAEQGNSVSLSDDGTYLMVGGPSDNSGVGAVWPFTQSNGSWVQPGAKLTPSDATGAAGFGGSVSLGAPGGHIVAIGGRADNGFQGAVWVFSQPHGSPTWSQLGAKLVGTDGVGTPHQGTSVAISYDTGTILEGGDDDNTNVGAAWPFVIGGAAPSITSVGPTAATAGGPAFTVTVNGANFLPGAVVQWNGTALTTTFVSSAQLTATVPSALFPSAGAANITVVNPDGNASGASNFTINGPVIITGPASLPAGTYGQAYSTTITASGGAPPYTFSAPALPAGLAINPSTGAISGAPTVAFNGSVPVTVTDSNLAPATMTYSLIINAVVSIVCTPSTLNFTYTIGGGQPSGESCSITSSPSGVSVSASATTLSGGSWLIVSPNSGTTPLAPTISVNTQSLAATTYSGSVVVTGSVVPTTILPVTLTVNPNPSQPAFTLTPSSATAPATASTGSTALSLSPASNTAWTAASTATWLHITSPSGDAGSGAATIDYSVDANTGAARSGSITVSSGGDVAATLTVTQAAVGCSALSVSPTSFVFTVPGPNAGIGVLTFNEAGCSWTASTNNTALITGLPASGNTRTITFGVAPGATAATANITIGTTPTTTVTVTRNAPVCTYTIATAGSIGTSQSFLAGGGGGSVNVTAPAGCSWTAVSNNSFLSVTGGASGSGSGTVNYSVAANPSSTSPQTGTLTVAGVAYTVNQTPQGNQSYNCTANAGVSPIIRSEGIAELAGDVVINCSGVSAGAVTGNVLVTLNTSLTNHTLNANEDPSGLTTDALLLVDEPSSGSLVLSGAGQNVYRGTVAGPQAVIFNNVLLAANGSFSHVFRITNVRGDATHLAGAPMTASVSIQSAAPFSVVNPSQTVGFAVGSSSNFTLVSSSTAPNGYLPITFMENFATAYRIRLAPGQDPSTAGTVYNSESGYVNSAVLGSDTGFATNGTRLVARFANIPAGTNVYAPVAQSAGSASAQLMFADSNGTGGLPMQGSGQVTGYQPVVLDATGAGTATWEITASNPSAIDSLTFNLLFSNPTLTVLSSCTQGTAPSICGALGPQPPFEVSAPSNTAPVPRFVNPTVTAPAVPALSIAPITAGGQSGSTSSVKLKPRILAARAASAATSATPPPLAVGGTLSASLLLASIPSSSSQSSVTNGFVGVTLPSTYTITSCTAQGGTCAFGGSQTPNQVSVNYPSVDSGQSSIIDFTADTSDTSDTLAAISASATSDAGNSLPGFSQSLPVSPGAAFALSFEASAPTIAPGLAIAYYLQLTNSGSGNKLDGDPLTVTITPDSQLTNVCQGQSTGGTWSCTPSCANSGTPMVCTDSSLVPAGGSTSLAVNGIVPQSAGGTLSTSATLTFGGRVSAAEVATTTTSGGSGCSFSLIPPSASLPATGTSSVEACPNNPGFPNCGVAPETPVYLAVTPIGACGAWTATSSDPGVLQIASGASGNGPGTFGFTLLSNTHNGQQNYTITVASGAGSATYSVTEAGSPLTGSVGQTYREVYALYEQLLGRDPDPAGFAFWTGQGGAGLGQMADSFLTSPEAFNSDFAAMAAFQAATGGPPTYAQYTAAVASIRAGTQTVGGLFNSLTGSGFTAATLYQNLLNRSPAAGDSACINTGLSACFQTIIGFPATATPVGAANNEFQSTGSYHTAADHTNALYVQMIYYVTVSRDPDASGLAFWIGVANSGGPGVLFQGSAGYPTRIQILGPGTPGQGFIGSPEFQGLFAN